MAFSVTVLQARCAALGFWPGPIDGIMGQRSRAAYVAAMSSQQDKGLPFVHESGISRIHWHWTAGGYKANATDMAHYHIVIEGDGKVIRCQADMAAPRAHTLNANTGAIGISMCCMAGAVERPFAWGDAPMTEKQLYGLVVETAKLCRLYDIPVSRWSTLSHAEIQPSLGIAQKQKWDITILPGMEDPKDPITTGDMIRDMVRRELKNM